MQPWFFYEFTALCRELISLRPRERSDRTRPEDNRLTVYATQPELA